MRELSRSRRRARRPLSTTPSTKMRSAENVENRASLPCVFPSSRGFRLREGPSRLSNRSPLTLRPGTEGGNDVQSSHLDIRHTTSGEHLRREAKRSRDAGLAARRGPSRAVRARSRSYGSARDTRREPRRTPVRTRDGVSPPSRTRFDARRSRARRLPPRAWPGRSRVERVQRTLPASYGGIRRTGG